MGIISKGKSLILADSLHPNGKDRFTTFALKFPKVLLAELNTHRELVRNVGSTRATPTSVMVKNAELDPYIPEMLANQPGMMGIDTLTAEQKADAMLVWLHALENAVNSTTKLNELGVHKQAANRLLDTFSQIELVLSGTFWDNFFKLRTHESTQPRFKQIADEMYEQYNNSTPTQLHYGEWHLPFATITEEGLDLETKIKVCIARIARVSYQSHGKDHSVENDCKLANRLLNDKHMTPFEHIAKVIDNDNNLLTFNWEGEQIYLANSKLLRCLFYDPKDHVIRWSRQFSGFYTYRHHIEDDVSISL